MIYYVGQVEDESEIPDPDSGIGTLAGQAWASVTRSALMPGCVTPTTSSAPGNTTGRRSHVTYLPLPTSKKQTRRWLNKVPDYSLSNFHKFENKHHHRKLLSVGFHLNCHTRNFIHRLESKNYPHNKVNRTTR